jgi:hypothetical protein
MITEMMQVKRFLGIKFGYGEPIADGVYAIPTTTSKGNAFMKLEMKEGNAEGKDNFSLYWDEKLTLSWYYTDKPENLEEGKFSTLFRQIEEERVK